MRLHKRRAALACLVGVAGMALGACSSSKGGGGTSSATTASAGGGTTAATLPPNAKVTGNLSGPGVTPTTITIGQIATTTGPVPGLFQGAFDGLDAWVAWINANGGIDGRQVKVDRVDDGFNCNTYTNAMNQFATSTFAVVGNVTLEDTCGKATLAANPNMIDVQALELDPTLYSVPNVYTPAPNPPGGITTGLEYMKQKFPAAITHSAQLVGAAAAANGKEEQLTAESVGYHYVYVRDIPDLTTNFTTYILAMKAQGVQFVDMTDLADTSDANFLQQAAQQNFHPDVVYGASAYDASEFKLLGDASLANNVLWSALPTAMYLGQDRATVPAVNTYLTWMANAHQNAPSTLYSVQAWAAGQLLVKAMQEAGSSITQSSVLAALKGITSFDANGLIGRDNPGDKMGTPCVVMANVQNGSWVRAYPKTGFDCSGTYRPIPLSEVTK
ncbi:MAG: ABC transporter substrate-binding protein [Actinomycetota bacterium]|nr:ABC transporter substrate-binding protein [Actinomycetota bacterium]